MVYDELVKLDKKVYRYYGELVVDVDDINNIPMMHSEHFLPTHCKGFSWWNIRDYCGGGEDYYIKLFSIDDAITICDRIENYNLRDYLKNFKNSQGIIDKLLLGMRTSKKEVYLVEFIPLIILGIVIIRGCIAN